MEKSNKRVYDKNKLTGITKTIAESDSRFGNMAESTGGGTPMKPGDKIDYVAEDSDDADAYREKHPNAIVRTLQPRNEDGTFAHNATNFRGRRFEGRGKYGLTLYVDYKKLLKIFDTKNVVSEIDGKRYISAIKMDIEQLKKAVQEFVYNRKTEGGEFSGGLSEKSLVKKVGRKAKAEIDGKKYVVDFNKLSKITQAKLKEGEENFEKSGNADYNSDSKKLKKYLDEGKVAEFYNENKSKFDEIEKLSDGKYTPEIVMANLENGNITSLNTLLFKLKSK